MNFDSFCWSSSLKFFFFSQLRYAHQLFFRCVFGCWRQEGDICLYVYLQWLVNDGDLGQILVYVSVWNLFLYWLHSFVRRVEVAREVLGVWRAAELRRLAGVSLQRPDTALFCCPAHFPPQLCCFLKSSQICRGQHFVPYNKMFVWFLFVQQSGIFLWCQHLICVWCLWAALGRNSLMVLSACCFITETLNTWHSSAILSVSCLR